MQINFFLLRKCIMQNFNIRNSIIQQFFKLQQMKSEHIEFQELKKKR